jgi:hypothetical protein
MRATRVPPRSRPGSAPGCDRGSQRGENGQRLPDLRARPLEGASAICHRCAPSSLHSGRCSGASCASGIRCTTDSDCPPAAAATWRATRAAGRRGPRRRSVAMSLGRRPRFSRASAARRHRPCARRRPPARRPERTSAAPSTGASGASDRVRSSSSSFLERAAADIPVERLHASLSGTSCRCLDNDTIVGHSPRRDPRDGRAFEV